MSDRAKNTAEIQVLDAQNVAVKQPPSSKFMDIIWEASQDLSVDLDRLRALKDIYYEMRKEEARIEFIAAKSEMMTELPDIRKLQTNTQTRSKYADWGACNQLCNPVITKHGFNLSFFVTNQSNDDVTVKGMLSYKNGHFEEMEMTLPLDKTGFKGNANKNDAQALKSSTSYAKNSIGQMMLNLVVVEECNDGNSQLADGVNGDSKWFKRINDCERSMVSMGLLQQDIKDDKDLTGTTRIAVIASFKQKLNDIKQGV